MRGESNAIGIRTTKAPYSNVGAYYIDFEFEENKRKICEDIERIKAYLEKGKIVVIPSDGIGTGLARLDKYAPQTLQYIIDKINSLVLKYNKQRREV